MNSGATCKTPGRCVEPKRFGVRSSLMLMALVTACLTASASVTAQPVDVVTAEDPAQPGFFTLNFGQFGGIASGSITSTDYGLRVDPVGGTAELVEYFQLVEPLTLPGGISTGNIIVQVVPGSSTGTYNERTGGFTTSETYAIFFDGDLSAFNLESPVFLPSTSNGRVELGGADGGRIDLQWDGRGELFNPFDPETPLEFSYTCTVNTVFAARPDMLLTLGLAPDVRALNLPAGLEKSFVTKLDHAARHVDLGNVVPAIRNLQAFVSSVDAQAGKSIRDEDAERLRSGAAETIALIGVTRSLALPAPTGKPGNKAGFGR